MLLDISILRLVILLKLFLLGCSINLQIIVSDYFCVYMCAVCVHMGMCLFACLASTRNPTLVSTCVLPLTYSLLFFVLRQFYHTVLAGLELIVKASFELRDLPLSVSLVQ